MTNDEVLAKQCVREGVAEINRAVADCNMHLEPDRPIRIDWGRGNHQEKQNEGNYRGAFSHVQSGRLQWNGLDCALRSVAATSHI